MAVLGKRKAPEPTVSTEDAQEIFRRHFEAQFLPLPEAERKAQEEDEDEDDSDGSGGEADEWGGLSNDEGSSEDDDDESGVDEEEEEEDGRTSNASAANASLLANVMARHSSHRSSRLLCLSSFQNKHNVQTRTQSLHGTPPSHQLTKPRQY